MVSRGSGMYWIGSLAAASDDRLKISEDFPGQQVEAGILIEKD
jgi:hypothetical protein